MNIYGVALLAACYLLGKLIGDLLGVVLDINGNIGGVGFAMALLVAANTYQKRKNIENTKTTNGILFWGAMYIPVIVAMSASQNVKAALTGGWAAVLVGIISTATCFMLVPVVSKLGKSNNSVEF